MYLFKELTCDWILRLQGACLQERGAGTQPGSFSSCRCRGGAPPEVAGPPQRSFLPFLWICTRLLPVGDGVVTAEN